MRPVKALNILTCGVIIAVSLSGCDVESANGPPADGRLAVGTWGGNGAGAIVTDSVTHVHIGCTYGDIIGRVVLDADGRFTAIGNFLLRAYPVAIGPTMPAQFVGRVSGSTLTITVTVNDTIDRKTVVVGPASVQWGKEPRMSNCPICRTPGDRLSALRSPTLVEVRAPWYDRFIALFARRVPDSAATLPTHSPPTSRQAENTPHR